MRFQCHESSKQQLSVVNLQQNQPWRKHIAGRICICFAHFVNIRNIILIILGDAWCNYVFNIWIHLTKHISIISEQQDSIFRGSFTPNHVSWKDQVTTGPSEPFDEVGTPPLPAAGAVKKILGGMLWGDTRCLQDVEKTMLYTFFISLSSDCHYCILLKSEFCLEWNTSFLQSMDIFSTKWPDSTHRRVSMITGVLFHSTVTVKRKDENTPRLVEGMTCITSASY